MPLLTTGVFVASGPRPGPRPPARPALWPSRALPAAAAPTPGARFSPAERERLLLERGIGPTTVERLERAGFASLEALRRAGVQQVVAAVVEAVETPGWRNRQRALERVVQATQAQ
jgi:hypothetical protein